MALIWTERRGPAYLVGLNRPDKQNALDEAMIAELDSALAAAARQPCVLVVHSTTPCVFAAGADIAELLERNADAALRSIGIRPMLADHGWGVELGRVAVEYAKSVAAGRRVRTTVLDWSTAGSHVARQCGFTEVYRAAYDRQPCTVLEHPDIPVPATLP